MTPMTTESPYTPELADCEAVTIASLHAHEREMITLVGQGFKDRVIAEGLSLAEAAVRAQLAAICAKLGVANRLELVVYAYYHGLAQPPR
jgi:DNA-binding NarL/FixJ family response regulator